MTTMMLLCVAQEGERERQRRTQLTPFHFCCQLSVQERGEREEREREMEIFDEAEEEESGFN